MTDFIRNILVTAAAANASASAPPSAASAAAERAKPVNQIQIPPAVVAALPEMQRLIKVEIVDGAASSSPPSSFPSSSSPSSSAVDAGKAQRAARRDVVNARRDKRKALAQASTSHAPSSPLGLTSGADSCSDSEDEFDDKSKKMKTSATSSVPMAGGLAASESKKPSFSSSMPPTPGLLFTPEIDAAGEERLRAMEAQLETLDPDSKEAKKKRRLIRNRMSAQLHRERKKAYVGQLEDQLLEKDRELKLLQEKLAKLMADGPKAEVETTKPAVPAPTPAAVVVAPKVDEVVIKEEPQTWDAPTWAIDAADSWDLHGLEDSEMAELETADLLRDFDDPFAGLGGAEYPELGKPHHEIHAAKKNLAMMAAVMFSVSFFGNGPAFYNVTPGSSFGSTFGANPPKDMSQMSIASRIVACLEKTSWKEFRTVSSWISARAAAEKAEQADETEDEMDAAPTRAVASPSAASDVTDCSGSLCGSPAQSTMDDLGETDLIDEFEYPVEDPFGAAASADWLDDVEKDLPKHNEDAAYFLSDAMLNEPVVPKQKPTTTSSSSLTSRLYESLTALWREKNQVLLTVRNDKQQVLQRSVADMSTIREGLSSGNFFTKVFGADGAESAASEDQSVTFLYPMSAFAPEIKPTAARSDDAADPVFFEVSCQLSGGATEAARM